MPGPQTPPGESALQSREIVAPLTALTSTQVEFICSRSAEKAFHELKSWFSSASIIIQTDPDCQFIVELDASAVGVGAILSQHSMKDEKVHPCAFFPDALLHLSVTMTLVTESCLLSSSPWRNGAIGLKDRRFHLWFGRITRI